MAKKKSTPLVAELRRLLRKLPDTETMEILVPDILGILRGKRVRRQSFEKTCTEGFMFPAGSILMNAIGDFVPGMIGESDGDPDTPCALISGSMAPVPWSSRPAAQALFRVLDEDGRPFFADPRAVLERSLQPLQKTGLKVVMATELEFYLLDGSASELRENTDVKEFYLGLRGEESSFRDVKHYRRRKRWLS